MRIAIDCRMIGSGGIGSFISELIPYFLEENECLLIGSHGQCAPFLRLANVEFCFCDIKPFSLKETFFFPQDVLEAIHHYDVYFTPYCNIPSGINLPIFSVIHDVVFLDVKGLTSMLGKIGRKMFYKRAINYSNTIFTVSEFSKERIIHHLKCKKPLKIVYNSAPSYLKEPFEKKAEKKDQILFVGNIKKHKGLKILLDAFENARKTDENFKSKLVIVGNAENFRTGDEETVERIKRIDSSADSQNISQNGSESLVVFTGKISNDELKYLYAESKFLVQPSLYEGFGLPPLEALTVGTRAIISDIPVFKEIYEGLPVTFFKSESAGDLAEKMLAFKDEPFTEKEKELISSKYSYKKSAEIILKEFAQNRP